MTYRTLFLLQTDLYPPAGGVSLRNWQNINLMRAYGAVGLFSIYKGAACDQLPVQFALWHHHDLSTPQRTAWEKIQRRLWRWRPDGNARADWLYSASIAQQLKATLKAFQPTLIIVEEIWLFRYLPILRQWGCPIILDDPNVEGDDSRYPDRSAMALLKLQKIRYIEEQFVQRADQVWMCSQQDIDGLGRLYPSTKDTVQTCLVPNGVNPLDYQNLQALPQPSDCQGEAPTLLYLGRFSYAPNAEAAEILLRDIFPAVKAMIPDCRLLLVGCEPTVPLQQLAQQQPDVIVTGRVDDVKPYLAAASLMVVPLQRGSGTRLKLLEAFAAHCPVISTAKGAEGLAVEDGKHLLLRETPAAMVDAIQRLLHAPPQAQALAAMAHRLFLAHYGWPAVNQQIQTALGRLSIAPAAGQPPAPLPM